MLAGRPVHFRVVEPWEKPAEAASGRTLGRVVFATVTFTLMLAAIVFARRNLTRGRGDRRGAFRIAVYAATALFLGRLGLVTHTADLSAEWNLVQNLAGLCLFRGLTVWLLLLAVEPYVRRQWPHMLIATNRVIAGRLRDPLVGREVLIGGLGGTLAAAVTLLQPAIAEGLGVRGVWPPNPLAHPSMDSPLGFAWTLFGAQGFAILMALSSLTLLIVLRLALRSYAAAMAAVWLCVSLLFLSGDGLAFRVAVSLASTAVLLFLLHRFGVFTLTVAAFFAEALRRAPLTFDTSAWYFPRSATILALLVAVAAGASTCPSRAGPPSAAPGSTTARRRRARAPDRGAAPRFRGLRSLAGRDRSRTAPLPGP